MKDCLGLHGHSAFGYVAIRQIGVGRKSVASDGHTTDLVHSLQTVKTVDISRYASEINRRSSPSALLRPHRGLQLGPPSRPAGCRLPAAAGHRAAVIDGYFYIDSDSRKIIILYVMAYTSPEGKTYKDYHEYCNSDDLETMEIAMKLYAGSRTPQNDEERKMLKEMKEASERGEILDFPMTPF